MKGIFFTFLSICAIFSYAQDLTVPEEILDELETIVVQTEEDTFTFRVAYPYEYNPEKEYKCFIGLSGGGQTMDIVNYCYAAWFRSGYFREYYTILPVVQNDTVNFRDYDKERIDRLLSAINEEFLTQPNWLIAGTSNGGVAAFNFVAAFPDRFEGIITSPGTLEEIEPNADWGHLKVVLCYGDKDHPDWIKEVKGTAKKLKKIVRSLKVIPLKGQGHILPIKFNVDKMYDPYFLDSK